MRFISRFYDEEGGARLRPRKLPAEDDVAQFIAHIERSDKAFQRAAFALESPRDPQFLRDRHFAAAHSRHGAAVHAAEAAFRAADDGSGVGQSARSRRKNILIIDGQHRLAALQFLRAHASRTRPSSINVPCIIFDGRSEDFATEMFVIINSTPTRINKSHLVDLYERVSWAEPDRRFAAHIAEMLYREADSPLRYRINRLGGRSKQEKWILQAELFNEIHRWVKRAWPRIEAEGTDKRVATRYYGMVRDFSEGGRSKYGTRRGAIADYMVTKPVTLKAMLRVCADLTAQDAEPEDDRVSRWTRASVALGGTVRANFRNEGFYERFPAKGQVERVARIHRELARIAGIQARSKASE